MRDGQLCWLCSFGGLIAIVSPAFAASSVTLAWTPSTNNIANYFIYYGIASRSYTNRTDVGNVTNRTISGLIEGTTYFFAATACSTSGLESDYSDEVSYAVPGSVTNPAPSIALTSPSNGASYTAPTTINLAASVTANGHTITKVQFYNGATLLGEDTSAPYSFTWSSVSTGSYNLTARVVYDAGNTVASSPVNVTVTSGGTLPSGLVAAYGFEEGSGVSVTDASGNGNQGSISGATWTTTGRFGAALVFNGTGAAVTMGNSALLDLTTNLTLEAWVYPTTLDGWRDVIYKGYTSGDLYYLEASTSMGPGPAIGMGTFGNGNVLSNPTALPLNTWSHLAATCDGTTLRLYVNGTQVASQVQTALIGTATQGLSIGGDTLHGTYFAGLIDEVRIYNRALSASDLQTDMNTAVVVTVTNPLPAIALTAPANGASYTAPASVNLAASVTANGHTITKVQFYNGVTLLGEDTSAPYSFTWSSVSAGSYSLTARTVYDAGSTVASSAANVTITNLPPTVALTSPTNGTNYTAPASVNLAASVTANGHTITKVQFYNGATLLGEDTSAPYTFTWSNVSAGSYSLSSSVVYDAGSTVASAPASITVSNLLSPSIALTSPTNGTSYTTPATINLAASVTANGHTITKVQFYNGATLLGEDTSAPYSFTWSNVGSGNYNLTAGVVYDSGSTVASSSVGIAVASATAVATLWPSTAVPGVVDDGPDSAVELGVKFRSDVAGSITGIRFYKASANTGTHVGNLWTSTGTLLATATFTGETASGWQQVFFAAPVAITANTVYVASYHANNGHFSVNWNYFSVNGVDNPPLHAPANGVSGGNGVYAYGASSAFPNQTSDAANYWVDVVLQAGPAPTLTAIAVTPANPTILAGATQQFTATGTYSDGSTQNLTSQAAWVSSSTTVATVNANGLATAVSAGTTTLSAGLTGVIGSSTLTVTANPPTIALTSPANGASYTAPASVNLAASVTANGHTITKVQFYNGATLLGEDTSAPYSFTWSSVSAGSYSLTARTVYDAGSTVASSAANVTVTNPVPTVALTSPANGAGYTAPATVNVAASVTANGHTITKVQFYNGATLLSEDTSTPYSFNWSNVVAGSYRLTARAVYDAGSTVDSSPVNINVMGLPAPWQTADIGSVGVVGSAGMSNGLYTVKGAGTISGTADNFCFVYQPLSGDGEIKVRLNSVGDTGTNGRIGVMIRESLTSGSKYAFMGISPDGTFRWQRRNNTGSTTVSRTSTNGTPPNAWVRLVRGGDSLQGYWSTNGTNWTIMNYLSIKMATNIYVGLAVASGSSNTLNTATFTNLTVVP